jgi:hypothetical protein
LQNEDKMIGASIDQNFVSLWAVQLSVSFHLSRRHLVTF